MDKSPRNKDDQMDKKAAKRIVLLEDLDGAEDEIIGGASEKLFFGESPLPFSDFPPLGGSSNSGK